MFCSGSYDVDLASTGSEEVEDGRELSVPSAWRACSEGGSGS